MSKTCSCDLIFRPAFPDEESRAKYVEGDRVPVGRSEWFLALTRGPVERIVGVIRYGRSAPAADHPGGIDFRMTAGPGGELAGKEQDLLESFTTFLAARFKGRLRHLPLLPAEHPWNEAFANAGFEIRYREYQLLASVKPLAMRASRSNQALQRHHSPLAAGQIVPVRECTPDEVIALLEKTRLMKEAGVRAIWDTEDPAVLDRDASACFILHGKVLGVIMAASHGNELEVMAIAVREEVPGARLRVPPPLMHHMFEATAHRNHERVFLRANADTARSSFNFGKRTGGEVVADLRRWVKEIGGP